MQLRYQLKSGSKSGLRRSQKQIKSDRYELDSAPNPRTSGIKSSLL